MPESRTIDHELFKVKRANSDQESMWDDFEFGGNRSKYAEYYNDMFQYDAGDWTVTTTEAGAGSATEAITDEVGGVLLLTNAAGDDDLDSLQLTGESALPAAGKKLWFEARVKVSDADDTDMLVGLVVTDTTPLAHTDGIVFKSDDGDAQLDFSTTASSTASTDNNIATLSDATYVKVGFKVTGTGLVEYWLNDVKKGSFTSNIPTTEMRPTLHIQNGSTNARTMSIDYIRLVQER